MKDRSPKIQVHKINTPYPVGPVDIFEIWTGGKHLLIDTGPPTEEAILYLTKHVDLASLDYLLLTHCHPDHYGLAQYILDRSKAQLIIAEVDSRLIELFGQRLDFLSATFSQMGLPERLLVQFSSLMPKFQGDIPFPRSFLLLEESGQLLAELGITWLSCPGHSQSDIIFLVGNHAITGDVLLRNIFSAPMLDMDLKKGEGRFSNYQAYCDSLIKFQSLKGYHIRPSHNDWVVSIETQVMFYCRKIFQRSRKIKPLSDQHMSLGSVLSRLFPDLMEQPFKLYIKIGELFFLLDYLSDPQRLHDSLAVLDLKKALGV